MWNVSNYSKWVLLGILSVCPALVSTNALANSFTFGVVGESALFNYSLDLGGGNFLTATTEYTVDAISANSVTFTTVVRNTSSTTTNQGIHSIGFKSTAPMLQQIGSSLTQIAGGTGTFINVLIDTNFPGFQTVEMCAQVGNNCSGGAQGSSIGEGVGGFDNFSLTLAYAAPSTTTPPSFIIDSPLIRFKGDLGSYTFEACENGCGRNPIPEPSTMLLFGTGLATLVGWRYRKRVKS